MTEKNASRNKPFDQETSELCTKISAEVMRPLVTQKEFVYIDADTLFDFRLGAIMAKVTGEDDYKYVMEHVHEYLDAPTLECAKFFPKFGMTEKDIDEFLVDPNYATVRAVISPATRLLGELSVIVRVLNSINASKETQRPITVVVNQRHALLEPFNKRLIEDSVYRGDKYAKVEYTNFPTWNDVPEAVLKKQDVIIVYDLNEFLREGTTSQKLLATVEEFAMTDIMAITQVTSTKVNDVELGLQNLSNVMELMCDKFTFINKTLLTRESNNG